MSISWRIQGRDQVEESFGLRLITLAMAWCAGVALGSASGDLWISLGLTMVITAGHLFSWFTRRWHNGLWPLLLVLPIVGATVLLLPSLPGAVRGDWLAPMRYILLLQALASFHLRSRGGLYTAQLLSGAVLLVSSQMAFGSGFLLFFIAFFGLFLGFLAVATRADALRGALAQAHWPGQAQRAAWLGVTGGSVVAVGVAFFILLPWGTIQSDGSAAAGEASLPLTGEGLTLGSPLTPDAPEREVPPSSPTTPPSNQGGEIPAPNRQPEPGDAPGVSPGSQPEDEVPESDGDAPGAGGGDSVEPATPPVRSSPVASYWRGQTYSSFDRDQGRWLPDTSDRLVGTGFARQAPVYSQTFYLREPQLVPLAGYAPVDWLVLSQRDSTGVLSEGTVYRVVSRRQSYDPEQLRQAAAGRWVLPERLASIPPEVRALVPEIVGDETDPLNVSLRISRYLRDHYRYDGSTGGPELAMPVDQFLFDGNGAGGAADFASAHAAWAHAAGLDARVVTGYLTGQFDAFSGTYLVRESDAHIWTEVRLAGAGWVPFDPSPRPEVIAGGRAGSVTSGLLGGILRLRVGDDARVAVGAAIMGLERLALPVLVPAAVAGMVLLAFLLIRRRRRAGHRALLRDYSRLPGAERRDVLVAYQRLMKRLRAQVVPRLPAETISGYFLRLEQTFPGHQEEFAWLRRVAVEAAYAPTALEIVGAPEVRRRFGQLSQQLRG